MPSDGGVRAAFWGNCANIVFAESLDISEGSCTNSCLAAYLSVVNPLTADFGYPKMEVNEFMEVSKRAMSQYNLSADKICQSDPDKDYCPQGKIYADNIAKHGFATWYRWSIENWGTKWNAYNTHTGDDNTVAFQTAWSNPRPIISKLAEVFPDITFRHSWADEDFGINTGKHRLENGKTAEIICFDALSNEAYENAAEVWNVELSEMGFVFDKEKGGYVYAEDEEDESEEPSESPKMS